MRAWVSALTAVKVTAAARTSIILPSLISGVPGRVAAQVYVEMSNICSGALFGECTSGRRVQRAYSAVADTRVEVFQLVGSQLFVCFCVTSQVRNKHNSFLTVGQPVDKCWRWACKGAARQERC